MLPLTLNATATSDLTVCILGVGIVFAGLIAIIILCKILGAVCQISEKIGANEGEKNNTATTAGAVHNVSSASNTPAEIPNRGETVAAIATAIAEELGTDVSAIRILSIEKL